VIALALLLAAAPATSAAPPARSWAIHAGGGLATAASEFEASAHFVEFAEPGTITTRQQPGSGGAFEAGLWRAATRRLGIALTASRERRDAPGAFTASLPHPLYLDRHRVAEGPIDGGTRPEPAIHLGLVWSQPIGGVTLRLAAGPSYVAAEGDLVEAVTHDEEYPYDAVHVTGVRTSAAKGSALGGHVAAALERRLSPRSAIEGGARWSRASVRLESGGGNATREADVTAGGLTAALALRLYF
jgi:hypothetical protein